MAIGEDRGFGAGQKRAGHAPSRPMGMGIEPDDPIACERAEAREPAAARLGLGQQKTLAALVHGPDIALQPQAGGPAFHLGAAVAAGPEAADRFLMNALDEGGVAGRSRPDDEAGRQRHGSDALA
jgi:hypothetical protein